MGKDVIVSPLAMKAAKLFIWKDGSPSCRLPWAQRRDGRNTLFASDGHTLIVIDDVKGRHYPRKPRQVGGKPVAGAPPDWMGLIRDLKKPRAGTSVELFIGYNNRILRAAFLLGVEAVQITTRGPAEAVSYQIGAHAYALMMPRRGDVADPLPAWLAGVVAEKKT